MFERKKTMKRQFSFFLSFFGILWRKKAFHFYLLQALQFDHDDRVEMKYK